MAQPNTVSWTVSPPLIFLSLRSMLKQDIECTPADLIYGSSLRLPGELFDPTSSLPCPDPSEYVMQLRSALRNLCAPHLRPQNRDSPCISPDLKTAILGFVRCDTVRKPLQRPYDCPYRVNKLNDKLYTCDLHGHRGSVSFDCLKPAIV